MFPVKFLIYTFPCINCEYRHHNIHDCQHDMNKSHFCPKETILFSPYIHCSENACSDRTDYVHYQPIVDWVNRWKIHFTSVVLFHQNKVERAYCTHHKHHSSWMISKLEHSFNHKTIDNRDLGIAEMIEKHSNWWWCSCSPCLLTITVICDLVDHKTYGDTETPPCIYFAL